MAAESALMAHLLTFINVFAHLHRSGSESFRTIALETSFHIGTRSVATNVGHGALVIVNAFTPGTVQYETHWTFTTERSIRVDAFATFTDARHYVTLV